MSRSKVQEPISTGDRDNDDNRSNNGSVAVDIERRGLLNDTSTGRAKPSKPSSSSSHPWRILLDLPCAVMTIVFVCFLIGILVTNRPVPDTTTVAPHSNHAGANGGNGNGNGGNVPVVSACGNDHATYNGTHCNCKDGYHRLAPDQYCIENGGSSSPSPSTSTPTTPSSGNDASNAPSSAPSPSSSTVASGSDHGSHASTPSTSPSSSFVVPPSRR